MDWWRGRLRMGQRLGRILGFGIGALLDQALEGADAKAAQTEAGGGAYDTAGGGQHSDPRQERNSFLFSLWSSPPTSSAPTAR